jgi:hypothetical protein
VLTNPEDRAIINQFADEVESLSRLEVTVPGWFASEPSNPTRAVIEVVLPKLFKPEPTSDFDTLLNALEVA